MRRRSPSPVVTGNVSRARMRFESGGSIKNNKTSPSPVPSGIGWGPGTRNPENPELGYEPLTSSQHQTLPRTFRFMNNNYNNIDTKALGRSQRGGLGSQPLQNIEASYGSEATINRFLSGSSYANNINTVITLFK